MQLYTVYYDASTNQIIHIHAHGAPFHCNVEEYTIEDGTVATIELDETQVPESLRLGECHERDMKMFIVVDGTIVDTKGEM